MKKFLFLFLVFAGLMFSKPAEATHYMGGEITWQCLPNGNFRFIMHLYRECYGTTYPDSLTMYTTSPLGGITMHKLPDSLGGKIEISPVCNPDTSLPHISCIPGISGFNTGAIEMWTYTSDNSYPAGVTLSGVPPASGWMFYYSDCCRNPNTSVINSNLKDMFVRAVMYSYNGQSAYPCMDDSPVFAEPPVFVMCTAFPSAFANLAIDPDNPMDIIDYDWAPLLENFNNPITSYAPGYSYDSPFPDTLYNSNNIPATIDSASGLVTFTSFTQGAFPYVNKVTSYRNGFKIAEVFREVQLIVLNCAPNQPPVISLDNIPLPPSTDFIDISAFPGDTVELQLVFIDTIPPYLPNQQLQTIGVRAYGNQFGAGFVSDSSGCNQPPCAVLNPPTPLYSQFGTNTNFRWICTMDHLQMPAGGFFNKKLFHFYFNYSDDYCPAPAVKDVVIRVNLSQLVQAPEWDCAMLHNNGDVSLEWTPPSDPDSLVIAYIIEYSDNTSGPFLVVDTINNYYSTNYIHQPPPANTHWYRLRTMYLYSGNTIHTEPNLTRVMVNSFVTDKPSLCPGDTLTLTFTGYAPAGTTFDWFLDGGQMVSGNITSVLKVIFNTAGQANISLNLQVSGCNSDTVAENVTVYNPPTPVITGPGNICEGVPVTYTASGGISYSWSTGASGNSITISPVSSGSISVTATDINSCKGSSSKFLQIITTFSSETICMVSVDPLINRPVVIWEKTGGVHTKAFNIYRQHPVSGVKEFAGSTTFANGGSFTDNATDPSFNSWQYFLTVVDSCDNESAYSPLHHTIHLVGLNTNPGVHLSWYPYTGFSFNKYYIYRDVDATGFVVIDSVSASTISYNDNPPSGQLEYIVAVRRWSGCSWGSPANNDLAFSNVAIPGTPGIDEISHNNSFIIFPNPAEDYLILSSKNPYGEEFLFSISDPSGKAMFEEIFPGIEKEYKVSIEYLVPGVYFYRVMGGGMVVQAGKFLVR